MEKDTAYMMEALALAEKAYELDESPIGALVVYKDQVIGRGYNRRNTDKHALAHAEILAIHEACQNIGDWRLEECTMYITLEPCPMCSGAIVQARIPRVVFGARSPKAGFAGSVANILQMEALNHRCEVVEGVCEEEASLLLKTYFKNMRKKNKL